MSKLARLRILSNAFLLALLLLSTVALVAFALNFDRRPSFSAKHDDSRSLISDQGGKPGVDANYKSSSKPMPEPAGINARVVSNLNRKSFSLSTRSSSLNTESKTQPAIEAYLKPKPMLGSRAASTSMPLLPTGFQESIVFSGLTNPTAIEFASDGRVFVAEKSGLIKVFDNLSDNTPTVFADLRTQVHNFWDRGLLGLALHPNFPTSPFVYVLYTHDAAIGGTAPRWGTVGGTSDGCPNPPGATGDGCVVSGRLSRLQAAGNVMTGTEQVLIEDWCQQYPSHSIGTIAFGADGALYVSGGDGASFTFVDYGQDGNPRNPCGDPPVPVGGAQNPPTAEGGALRSQDLRTSGDPAGLDGAILRVNPDTGAALPDNPLINNPDQNARRVIAYGLRNPFRFTIRPGTNEVWVGDVGESTWEEINRIVSPTANVTNFGWPCYEGAGTHAGFDVSNLNICEALYAEGSHAPPFFAYRHTDKVVPGESVPTGSSSISGVAFYNGGNYPANYNGSLFFADYSRKAIWVMFNIPGSSQVSDLVAAYNFNEGSGSTATDVSGNGNTGTISGATWSTSGKNDKALSFDGINDWVTVLDSNPLDLSTGLTLSAWVFLTSSSGVRDIIIKEGSNVDIYNLYARNFRGKPESNVLVNGSNHTAEGATLGTNSWIHVAGTFDGATLRFFVNGVQAASQNLSGSIPSSTGPLRIGGNSIWGEFFQGRIDDVRVYRRALSAAEIQTDMNTPLVASSGGPAPTTETFIPNAAGPVQLKMGPAGDLFYVDFDGGTIRRVQYVANNQPPTAIALANPLSGSPPLTVNFNGATSTDPEGGPLTYSWDLNGDGVFGDSTLPQPVFTYTTPGGYTVSLRVTDSAGGSNVGTVFITVGSPPTAIIDTPAGTTTWKVGDVINFSGRATDPEQGTLPNSALTWSLILHHCPSNCHTHTVQDFIGVASGSFSAPDHDFPSHLELRLTVTDSTGLTDTESVLLNPQTVLLTFESSPSGLQLVVGGSSSATPFTRTVIVGSNNSIGATSPQALNSQVYSFTSWSDGGAQSHNIIASSAPTTYTAIFSETGVAGLVAAYSFNENSGTSVGDSSGNGHTGAISGATWTTLGKFGNALSFDGVNDWVTVNSTSLLSLTTAMTVEAWVFPTVSTGSRNVLIKEGTNRDTYNLYARSGGNKSEIYAFIGGANRSAEGAPLAANVWTHVAGTYDGGALRLYINGVQAAINNLASGSILTSTNPLRIGGNSIWGEFFQGRIDDVRIYNRALSQAEIQLDMNAPVGGLPPDTTPPVRSNGQPTGALPAGTTQTTLSLTTDENANCRYATSAGISYSSMPNVFTTTGSTSHSTTVTGLSNGGSYSFFVRCQDGTNNTNSDDFSISFSVAQAAGSGPVAAYGFNEGSGSTVGDSSGNGHTGTISGATRTTLGKFGSALSFDGVNDWVTVNSSSLLSLTTAMTIEAWVFPTSGSGPRNILIKEGVNRDLYNLYARNGGGISELYALIGGASRSVNSSPLTLNVWTHIAGTYDGSALRLYINGVEVAVNNLASGSILTSTNPLRIGGNSIWGEFFQGRIDEIRIYGRALTQAEIQLDMNTPVN